MIQVPALHAALRNTLVNYLVSSPSRPRLAAPLSVPRTAGVLVLDKLSSNTLLADATGTTGTAGSCLR